MSSRCSVCLQRENERATSHEVPQKAYPSYLDHTHIISEKTNKTVTPKISALKFFGTEYNISKPHTFSRRPNLLTLSLLCPNLTSQLGLCFVCESTTHSILRSRPTHNSFRACNNTTSSSLVRKTTSIHEFVQPPK